MLKSNFLMDGHYYIGLLEKTAHQINNLCLEFQIYVDETNEKCVKNEDVQGQIQTAIGKGQLLINQKFKQFRGLCDKNISAKNDSLPLKEGEFVTRDEDLAGFWDMVYLQVEDINKMFEKLSELRKNNWVSETKPVVKAPPKKKISTGPKTTETAASKARAEAARQRIQEMKKKAALAKNQNTEQPNAQIIN
ncbi:disks large-associated 4-like isoform X1 [Brachionus plicatilis]|uniref:Disks large-associated 4-like isoform X1 n=1 Tax=Brachionus plicatilis TaxID=10195 RepID=A0A3M7PXF3_BRAPC|nr:disks large-associated 4-like isoform X1 [Brachionus plicatilis]